MKGKITYMAVVEKEIEIPDEVIEISKRHKFDWTKEEDDKMRTFSENAWDSIEDSYDRIGIYYKENGKEWVLEEY